MGMIQLLKKREVLAATALSKSTLHDRINAGLFVRPVQVGVRSVAFPSTEVEALNRAVIAGQSHGEIRALVSRLHAERFAGAAHA